MFYLFLLELLSSYVDCMGCCFCHSDVTNCIIVSGWVTAVIHVSHGFEGTWMVHYITYIVHNVCFAKQWHTSYMVECTSVTGERLLWQLLIFWIHWQMIKHWGNLPSNKQPSKVKCHSLKDSITQLGEPLYNE